PPDLDDHGGGDAWRRALDAGPWRRLGAPAAAWLCHGRRPRAFAATHALHDADRLSLSRSTAVLARWRQGQGAQGSAGAGSSEVVHRYKATEISHFSANWQNGPSIYPWRGTRGPSLPILLMTMCGCSFIHTYWLSPG